MFTDSVCVICGGHADQLHHLFPQHLGGKNDGPTVWLCASHHAAVHRVATRIFKGKPIESGDDGDWLKIPAAIAIINRIVRAMVEAENKDLSQVESRIIIKLSKQRLRQVHRRKTDLGFSSIAAYLNYLIDRDLPPA